MAVRSNWVEQEWDGEIARTLVMIELGKSFLAVLAPNMEASRRRCLYLEWGRAFVLFNLKGNFEEAEKRCKGILSRFRRRYCCLGMNNTKGVRYGGAVIEDIVSQ